jgi:hypothetical protein
MGCSRHYLDPRSQALVADLLTGSYASCLRVHDTPLVGLDGPRGFHGSLLEVCTVAYPVGAARPERGDVSADRG